MIRFTLEGDVHIDKCAIRSDFQRNLLSFTMVAAISVATFIVADLPLFLLLPLILVGLSIRWLYRGWIA